MKVRTSKFLFIELTHTPLLGGVMTPPAVKCSVFAEILGEYDSSCTGGVMTPPYKTNTKLTDKSEFERLVFRRELCYHIYV